MAMDKLRLLLHAKYSLVHVPSDSKIRMWIHRTKANIRGGMAPEPAGLLAMKEILPYEAKERRIHEGPTVAELLEMAG